MIKYSLFILFLSLKYQIQMLNDLVIPKMITLINDWSMKAEPLLNTLCKHRKRCELQNAWRIKGWEHEGSIRGAWGVHEGGVIAA